MAQGKANPIRRLVVGTAGMAPVSWCYARMLPRLDRFVYRRTGGRRTFASWLSGLPIVMLTTTGAKTGLQRTVPVIGLPEGDDLVIFASNWGQARHPAWYQNLRTNPMATVTVEGVTRPVRADEVIGDERDRLWRRGLQIYPGWAAYERRAENRHIPIVRLTPAG